MPTLIPAPTIVQAAGTKPKRIEEYAGRQFQEITLVLRDMLRVEHEGGVLVAFSPATVHRDQ